MGRSEMKNKTAWKFLIQQDDGTIVSAYDNSPWVIGKWREVAVPTSSCVGLNCSVLVDQARDYVQGNVVAEVEYKGIVVTSSDKLTCQYMRIRRAWKFTAPAWKAYQDAKAPAEKAYQDAKAPAEKAYQDATAPAEKAYQDAKATAWKAYQDATATAWKAYQDAKAPAEKAYQDAKVTAWKAYQDATATAWKAYQDATAPAWKKILRTLERIGC
jgi:hypothetical protein